MFIGWRIVIDSVKWALIAFDVGVINVIETFYFKIEFVSWISRDFWPFHKIYESEIHTHTHVCMPKNPFHNICADISNQMTSGAPMQQIVFKV